MSIEKNHGVPRGSTTTLTAPIELLNMFADRLASLIPGSSAWGAVLAAADADGVLDELNAHVRYIEEALAACLAVPVGTSSSETALRALIPEWRGDVTFNDALAGIDRARRAVALRILAYVRYKSPSVTADVAAPVG